MLRNSFARGDSARLSFVRVSLELAATFCRLAKTSDDTHLPCYLRRARLAYEAAERFMFSVNMADKEFHALSADAERVKLTIEALKRRNRDTSASPSGPGEVPVATATWRSTAF